jgi:hypothetical protein
MAEIIVGRGGFPECSGCGEVLPFVHWMLDSRVRQPYDEKAVARGSSGPEVEEFAEKHRCCPDPQIERGESGILILDRRATRGEDYAPEG